MSSLQKAKMKDLTKDLFTKELIPVNVRVGGKKKDYSLTIYTPHFAKVPPESFTEIADGEIKKLSEEAQLYLRTMLQFSIFLPHGKREREFEINTLSHIPAFRGEQDLKTKYPRETELGFNPLLSDKSSLQKLYTIAESIGHKKDTPLPVLLNEAIYIEPQLEASMSSPIYEDYKKRVISQFWNKYESVIIKSVGLATSKKKKVAGDKYLTKEQQQKSCEILSEAQSLGSLRKEKHRKMFKETFKELRKKINASDKQGRETYKNITEAADALLKKTNWNEDPETGKLKVETDKNGNIVGFDIEAANNLYSSLLDQLESEVVNTDFLFYPPRIGGIDAKSLLLTDLLKYRRKGFRYIINEASDYEKWRGLKNVLDDLSGQDAAFQILLREAEAILYAFWGFVFKKAYRQVRHQLTLPERRAFLLFYMRTPGLGYRIPALDVTFKGFFRGMGKETTDLIVLGVFHKVKEIDGLEIQPELEKRWIN